ncbi:MAG: hypothetical protein ACXWKH_10070 [Limisphaerales bacterium]
MKRFQFAPNGIRDWKCEEVAHVALQFINVYKFAIPNCVKDRA